MSKVDWQYQISIYNEVDDVDPKDTESKALDINLDDVKSKSDVGRGVSEASKEEVNDVTFGGVEGDDQNDDEADINRYIISNYN
ncbi:unnamed protein product [Dovyalis caffra]|uniref:Uncharacterized protein n=1 Tax=Dovyalis caffra TaxID=77055 RepID=A0AAV1RPU3_9ROSI|nr:unnamed protein product [Dovyalis caffra]